MVAIRRKASLTQKCFKRTHMIIEPILNYCVFTRYNSLAAIARTWGMFMTIRKGGIFV
jgi:hypothetical protein